MRINVREAPFGPFVRILAIERGLTISDIARMICMGRSSVYRALMRPDRKNHRPPSLRMVIGIDQALCTIRPLSDEDRILLFIKAGYLPPFESRIVHTRDRNIYVAFLMDRPLRKEINYGSLGFS